MTLTIIDDDDDDDDNDVDSDDGDGATETESRSFAPPVITVPTLVRAANVATVVEAGGDGVDVDLGGGDGGDGDADEGVVGRANGVFSVADDPQVRKLVSEGDESVQRWATGSSVVSGNAILDATPYLDPSPLNPIYRDPDAIMRRIAAVKDQRQRLGMKFRAYALRAFSYARYLREHEQLCWITAATSRASWVGKLIAERSVEDLADLQEGLSLKTWDNQRNFHDIYVKFLSAHRHENQKKLKILLKQRRKIPDVV